jgi:hypothetical protein
MSPIFLQVAKSPILRILNHRCFPSKKVAASAASFLLRLTYALRGHQAHLMPKHGQLARPE